MKNGLAPILVSALLLGGCYVESETVYIEPNDGPDSSYSCATGIPVSATATIDADAAMETNPGTETGLYVEYLSGGLWIVYTTCGDVDEYGECEWDIATSVPDCAFVGAEGYELDPGETFETDDLGAWATLYTDYGYDGLYVQTQPGASLQLEALLDGQYAESYIFWVEDGAVRSGAPMTPIEFVPDAP